MDFGFEFVAARPKGQVADPPKQQPMRAGTDKVRRQPSTDQKKIRRQMAKSAAVSSVTASLDAELTATGSAQWVSRDQQVTANFDRQGSSLAVVVAHPEGIERQAFASLPAAVAWAIGFDTEMVRMGEFVDPALAASARSNVTAGRTQAAAFDGRWLPADSAFKVDDEFSNSDPQGNVREGWVWVPYPTDDLVADGMRSRMLAGRAQAVRDAGDNAYEEFTPDGTSDYNADFAHEVGVPQPPKINPDPQWTTASRTAEWEGGTPQQGPGGQWFYPSRSAAYNDPGMNPGDNPHAMDADQFSEWFNSTIPGGPLPEGESLPPQEYVPHDPHPRQLFRSAKTAARGFSASYSPTTNDYRAMELVPSTVRPFDGQTLLQQIGGGNVMAISGGRRAFVTDVEIGQNVADKETVGLYLPVGQGYGVLIWLDASDTYTVVRTRQGAAKGQQVRIYADQVGEAAYQASCYNNGPFGREGSLRTAADDFDDDAEMRATLDSWPTASRSIDAFRAIVNDHSAKMIDGVFVDMQTANAIVTVYDAISDGNKAKFISMPVDKMGAAAWKLLAKVSSSRQAMIPNLADPPADRSLCEQCREAKATVYAMDSGAGGWGGRYCDACADALKFPIRERLTSTGGMVWDDARGRYRLRNNNDEPAFGSEDWVNEQLDAGRTIDEIDDDLREATAERFESYREGSKTAGQFTDYNTPLPCGCSLANGRCANHAQMMQVIYNAYYSGPVGMAAKIYAVSDGYGEPGYVPEQGRDWSGVRDSSTEAIEAMYAVAMGRA